MEFLQRALCSDAAGAAHALEIVACLNKSGLRNALFDYITQLVWTATFKGQGWVNETCN